MHFTIPLHHTSQLLHPCIPPFCILLRIAINFSQLPLAIIFPTPIASLTDLWTRTIVRERGCPRWGGRGRGLRHPHSDPWLGDHLKLLNPDIPKHIRRSIATMGVATHRRLGYVLWAVINLLDHPLWNHEWGRVEATRKTTRKIAESKAYICHISTSLRHLSKNLGIDFLRSLLIHVLQLL